QLEPPPPQVLGTALGQGPGELSDAGQPGRGPRPRAAWGRQTLADQDRTDAVLRRDPLCDEGLAVGDQRPPLAGGLPRARHLRAFTAPSAGAGGAAPPPPPPRGGLRRARPLRELPEPIELGEAEGVVPVGLAFGVLVLPRLGAGICHLARE